MKSRLSLLITLSIALNYLKENFKEKKQDISKSPAALLLMIYYLLDLMFNVCPMKM
jgi:hypothetical protein